MRNKWKLPSQLGRLQAWPVTKSRKKGTDNRMHKESWQLTVEEGIEVLITVKIKTGVFTAGAVCFGRKAHLETKWKKSGRKRRHPSQLTAALRR